MASTGGQDIEEIGSPDGSKLWWLPGPGSFRRLTSFAVWSDARGACRPAVPPQIQRRAQVPPPAS